MTAEMFDGGLLPNVMRDADPIERIKPRDYCLSEICGTKEAERRGFKSNSLAKVDLGEIDQTVSECPRCGHYLFWASTTSDLLS